MLHVYPVDLDYMSRRLDLEAQCGEGKRTTITTCVTGTGQGSTGQ